MYIHWSLISITKSMENTAKNFALQLGSLVTLYASISGLIVLLFGIITIQYPDVASQGYWEYESAASSIRFSIALLVVSFPAYVILTRLVNNIRRNEDGTYLKLTKWLIYLSLLVGGALILGDLVMVINNFLNGELTIRFILKAFAFFVVVGSAFLYYLFDARGHWQTHEKQSIQYGIFVAAFVVAALIIGFLKIEAPTEVREMRIDSQQLSDLMSMQSRVEEYYMVKQVLPASLTEVYGNLAMPQASEGRTPYSYEKLSETSFQLCAGFAYPTSKAQQMEFTQPVFYEEPIKNPYNWDHNEGEWCFERVVEPNVPAVLKY